MTNPNIESLEPKPVWQCFAALSAVPHESKHEKRICALVKEMAAQQGFDVREDAVGNLVITVPATPGHESAPITVLQGHLDMVCEKNTGTQHNFDTDPIQLVLDTEDGEQIVRANGTTLGADNGIGVALAWAAATDPDAVHGPLELLLTIDEEQGMTGAKALAADFVKGKRMVNLDSEEDDAIYIGCAGGCDINLAFSLPRKPVSAGQEVVALNVAGLRGGHSGCDIHENRGNAIKLLIHTLVGAEVEGLCLAEFSGGSKRNAIPREARAVVVGPAGTLARITESAQRVQPLAHSLGETGATLTAQGVGADSVAGAANAADTACVLQALMAVPSSVLAVHPEVPGLVQTSNNLSVITMPDSGADTLKLAVQALSRGSNDARLACTVRSICAIGELAGATVTTGNDYPGWQPNMKSALLATGKQVYKKLFGEAPNVTAIHAGLECGIIGERLGGMDMMSFGPRIEGAHSPDERVYVASVQKAWTYVKALLAELA